MNCYHHEKEEAVAQCRNCGKFLCRRCASLYNMPLCAECARTEQEALREDLKKRIGIGVAIGIVTLIGQFISGIGNGNGSMLLKAIPIAYIAGSIPFGWRALSSITPKVFLYLPILGWLIYFAIKLYISLMIGWVACPIQIRNDRQKIALFDNVECNRYKEMSKLEHERQNYANDKEAEYCFSRRWTEDNQRIVK